MTAVTVTRADEADSIAWDDFIERSQTAEAYHEYRWRAVLESGLGCATHYLQANDDCGSVVGVLPLAQLKSRLFGNFLVSLPYLNYAGILADNESAEQALVIEASNLAAELGASHVELRHRDDVTLQLPRRSEKVAMLLPLPDSAEELWQGFKPKLRSQIRRPSKEGASCIEGGIELIDDFYAVFSRNMRDLGTPVHSKELFSSICEQFPDTTKLYVVYLDGRAAAAGITVQFRKTMEIPSASSLREFNRYSVNMLLYWTVLQSAIRAGCSVFDFGRSSPDTGTYQFKKQWGAKPQQLLWYYCMLHGDEIPKINPDNVKYQFATRVWKKLPLSLANFLGPRIVRHLP